MRKIKFTIAALSLLAVSHANAGNPPPGAILDLSGQTVENAVTEYSVSFTAAATETDIAFAIRNDPSFTFLSDISLIDTTSSSAANLITDGNFAAATLFTSVDPNWTYANPDNGAFPGEYVNFASYSGDGLSNVLYDGVSGSYDGVDQQVATNIGDAYQLSFWIYDASGATYSSVNDVLAYANAETVSAAASVPEPETFTLFAIGLLGLGLARGKKIHA
ncbi:MAG: PEP-CTERM sorting domain-containing protein [Methylomonas sp.]|jgi:hypothetical protein